MPLDQSAKPQSNPYVPPAPGPLLLETFGGINTSTTRPGVPDQQVYWMDGWIPLDQRNARTLYGVGTTLYNAVSAASSTVVWFGFSNIGSTPYCIIFLANGQVVAVNTTSLVATTILAPGTITSPSIINNGISQWGSQYLIIVANQTNGYWLWDGTNVYDAGTLSPTVEILDGGSGYPATVTITAAGGHGHGASINGSVSGGAIVSASIVAPGTGYQVGDVVYGVVAPNPTAGTGGSITASITGGTLNSLSIVAGGSGYSNQASLVFTVGGNAPPSAFPIVTAGVITGTSITNRGVLLLGATVSIVDTAQVASITLSIMPFGVSGTSAETYSGHVWVANGPLVQFTAPGSTGDFSTSNGGGNFTSNDSYLKIGFSRLIQSNGFLYLIADSSINYISGVQTSGTPETTTYTNQNADPSIGTPYPASVILQGQNILFANSVGVYILNGSKAVKISGMMDGVYGTVPNFSGLQLSSAHATIFNREIWMVLAKIVDPVSGATVNKMLMWDGKRWFVSQQDIDLSFIASQEINSVFTAYGTNGTIVSPMFQNATTGFQKTIQSRLWDEPGGYLLNHAAGRFWAVAQYYSHNSPDIIAQIDAMAVDNGTGTATISNNTATYTITGPTVNGLWATPPQAVGQQGILTGMTIKTSCDDMALISAMIDDKVVGYRG